jgi:hypothetical protein
MVSSVSRRRAVKYLVEEGLSSAAQGCWALGLARSSFYLVSRKRPNSQRLNPKIVELSEEILDTAIGVLQRCCAVEAGRLILNGYNECAEKRVCKSANAKGGLEELDLPAESGSGQSNSLMVWEWFI